MTLFVPCLIAFIVYAMLVIKFALEATESVVAYMAICLVGIFLVPALISDALNLLN